MENKEKEKKLFIKVSSLESIPSPPSPVERSLNSDKKYSNFYRKKYRRLKRNKKYKSDIKTQWHSPRYSSIISENNTEDILHSDGDIDFKEPITP